MMRDAVLWPEFLIDAASRGECVLFIGAGVSRHARQAGDSGASPVGWKDLLESLLNEVVPPKPDQRPRIRTQINSKIGAGDYLGAAQAIEAVYEKKGLGAEFRNRIATTVDGPTDDPFRPAEVHDAIGDLNPRIIVTTNYDNVLERQFSEGYRAVSYQSESLGAAIRSGSYVILKIHGTRNEPQDLILTRLDFTRLRRKGARSLAILEALFMTRTVLFLGYSLGDPDLQLILENQFGASGESAGHYMLAHDKSHSDIERRILREAYGVELLAYSGDREGGFKVAIEDLVAQTKEFQLQRSGTLP